MRRYPTILHRVALAVAEQRLDLGLSLSQLAKWSGVSRPTITKIEAGRHVNEELLLRVAATLDAIEARQPPKPVDHGLRQIEDDLQRLLYPTPPPGQPPLPGEWVPA